MDSSSVVNWYGSDCYLCGTSIDMTASRVVGDGDWYYGLHIEHVVPKKLGGTDDIENLRPAHGICNIKKAESPLIEHFKRYFPERLTDAILKEPSSGALAPRGPIRIGYIRANSSHTTTAEQSEKLEKAGVDRIFSDVYHGAHKTFPGLDSLIKEVRAGDTVVATSLDRLATSVKKLQEVCSVLADKKAEVEFIDEGIKTHEPGGRGFLVAITAFTEFSKSSRSEVTRTGLDKARTKGKKGGRKPKLTSEQKSEVVELRNSGELTIRAIAKIFDVSPPTVYRVLQESDD
jgi:DNA invertase Pin-like site-specific DNA recombinase